MEKDIEELLKKVKTNLESLTNPVELDSLWLEVFGQNGIFNHLTKKIKNIPQPEKANTGRLINEAKKNLEKVIATKKHELNLLKLNESIDVTAPARLPPVGHLHIVTTAIEEISYIFEKIGFTKVSYPEVEWEYFAFEALNMPSNHPARDDFETFFLDVPKNKKFGRAVLTPHTSSGQVKEMLTVDHPPIRMINIGKCYRPNWDISHTPMFHQFEGLVVDKGINITHLKGTMDYFAKQFFGPNRKTRLRPFHFQFTEPSFEVDISCGVCEGKGILKDKTKCRFCKEGWLELGGSGMVHPNVLKAGNIDTKLYTGFAFGWGVERTYMMKSGTKLDDLRLLYGNDIRFLEQF